MSSPNMSCDDCKDALTELVCDELSPQRRAEVEEHLRGCAECARALSRMQRVMSSARALPMEEPSPRLRSAVMAHAREALQRNAASVQAVETSSQGGGGFRAFVDWLSRWAMAPQVAMAAVLLLVVGIGIYALPFGADQPQAALVASEEAPAMAAPVPQAASATTAPTPAREAPAEPPAADEELAESSRKMQAPLRERATKSLDSYASAPPPRAKDEASSTVKGAVARRQSSMKKEAPSKSADLAEPWGGEGIGGAAVASGSAGGRARSAPYGAPVTQGKAAVANEDYAPAPVPAAPAPAAQARPAQASVEEEKVLGEAPISFLAEGIRDAQRGRYDAAIEKLSRAIREGSPEEQQTARLWLARSYRQRGNCASALQYYEPLLKNKGTAFDILSEAADCYERVGNASQATALRARATSPAGKAAAPKASKPAATQVAPKE